MRVTESTPWTGIVTVTIFHPDGTETVETFPNLITDAGKNLIAQALRDTAFDAEIKYLAWGTGSTAPAASDTTLVTEAGRKQVTSQTAGAGVGETDTVTYLGPDDANVAIAELGWFAGASATATADSGTLIARVLYSKTKTNKESIQVDRTDTFG